MTPLASLTPCVDVLPRTAAGKARSLRWYKGLRSEGWPADAVFVVEEQGRKAPDSYGVEEFAHALPLPGRAFRVRKCGERVPYSAFVSADGHTCHCDCAGGCYRREGVAECRHLAALKAAVSNGWL